MRINLDIHPLARSIGIFGAVAALATGVTFAALNNSATLTNSSILTASADLQVFNFNLPDWASTAPGFTVTGLVPGAGTDEHFYLKNNGGVNLNVTAHIPTLPGPPGGGYGFSGFENLKVDIKGDNCNVTVNSDMSALNSGNVTLPCNPLLPGDAGDSNDNGHVGNYTIHFDIDPDAITGSQAGVGNFDIVLTGTQPS